MQHGFPGLSQFINTPTRRRRTANKRKIEVVQGEGQHWMMTTSRGVSEERANKRRRRVGPPCEILAHSQLRTPQGVESNHQLLGRFCGLGFSETSRKLRFEGHRRELTQKAIAYAYLSTMSLCDTDWRDGWSASYNQTNEGLDISIIPSRRL